MARIECDGPALNERALWHSFNATENDPCNWVSGLVSFPLRWDFGPSEAASSQREG